MRKEIKQYSIGEAYNLMLNPKNRTMTMEDKLFMKLRTLRENRLRVLAFLNERSKEVNYGIQKENMEQQTA